MIDQYVGSYYNSGWNLNINQYKAWVATIAWAEGGRGGYVAHSQGALGSDVFDHRAVDSSFRFSTGIGPFQLDRGGGTENWGLWPTIDKLDPEKAVKSVLRLHYNTFGTGTDLEDFAENSLWFAINPNYGGDPAGHWNAVTGTNWNYHKNGKTELDWSNIKDQLAQNANNPDFLYEHNVRSSGTVKWNIKESEGIQTNTGKKVIFDGYYLTWLITARGWGGTELFEYYYTYRSDENIEIWVWDNSNDPVNKFKYIFVREYSTGPFPERRDGNIAGETLTSPAIGEAELPTAIIDSITPDPAVQGSDTVSFSGHGTDPDGTVVAYNWRSSVDGPLSTSAAFTKPASELSVGTHTIYFRVQDNDGAWSTDDSEALTINPPPELGSILVSSSPSGANIYLDGSFIGQTLYTITNVPAGMHTVKFTKTGYNDCEKTVTVVANQQTNVHCDLQSEDPISPSAVTDLATTDPTSNSIKLTWTAPGDDGNTGTATTYDIRYLEVTPIAESNWASAIQCTDEPSPNPAGSAEAFVVTGLSPDKTYYFALKTADEVPNWSPISNSPRGTTAPGEVSTISFDPSSSKIGAGSTTKINLTLDKAPNGLSGYNLTVSLSYVTVAEIVSVSFPSWATLYDISSLPADSVWMKAADLSDQVKSGATDVNLGTLTLRGDNQGTSDIVITVTKMDDDNGYPINPNTISGQIEVTSVIPIPGHTNPPTDPDSDGLYEDLNGNGMKDFDDVVQFFKYMEWIEDNEPIACFDFNCNGLIDFADIVALFKEV